MFYRVVHNSLQYGYINYVMFCTGEAAAHGFDNIVQASLCLLVVSCVISMRNVSDFGLETVNYDLHLFCNFNLDSSPPGQNGWHFADDMFKRIFLNANILISNKSSLKYVPRGLIDYIPALVQIMVRCRSGDKPLSETMLTQFSDAYMRH